MKKTHLSCAIIGLANSGKSTLINRFAGQKISIVTPKAQTTRCVIKAIACKGEAQLIFFDSPGIFDARAGRDREMVRSAMSCIYGADIVLVVIDSPRPALDKIFKHLKSLKNTTQDIIFLLNKCDISASNDDTKEALQDFFGKDKDCFEVSAKTGEGIEGLLAALEAKATAPGWLYDQDEITDAPMKFLAAEITREKLFISLGAELPYSLTVENEKWQENPDGSVSIYQIIKTIKKSHKNMIIGKKGTKIKEVGQLARVEISEIMQRKVHLFLFVKEIDERRFSYYTPENSD